MRHLVGTLFSSLLLRKIRPPSLGGISVGFCTYPSSCGYPKAPFLQRTIITPTQSSLGRGVLVGSNIIDQTAGRHFSSSRSSNRSSAAKVGSGTDPQSLLSSESNLGQNEYEEIAEETLESLFTYFDELLERSKKVEDGDVSYSTGVLTIKLGSHGTYVINKQTPNRQIWLSSPTSGPKRYDYINKTWIYKHNGESMLELLDLEIPRILELEDVNFKKNCSVEK